MTGLYLGSMKATTAANAIFLQCTASFWTIPLSLLFLRERPDRLRCSGSVWRRSGSPRSSLYGYDGRPNEGEGWRWDWRAGSFTPAW